MPHAYFIAECVDKHSDPLKARPTYLLVDPVDWNHEFEHWYVEENYACIDNEGRRYVLRWHPESGMKATVSEASQDNEVLFHKWLELWIENLPRKVWSALPLTIQSKGPMWVRSALSDPDILKRIASRK